jgi:hypothetical protein
MNGFVCWLLAFVCLVDFRVPKFPVALLASANVRPKRSIGFELASQFPAMRATFARGFGFTLRFARHFATP